TPSPCWRRRGSTSTPASRPAARTPTGRSSPTGSPTIQACRKRSSSSSATPRPPEASWPPSRKASQKRSPPPCARPEWPPRRSWDGSKGWERGGSESTRAAEGSSAWSSIPRRNWLSTAATPSATIRLQEDVSMRANLFALVLIALFAPAAVSAQSAAGAAPNETPALRDGQHDFDFQIGTWKYHLSRLDHPLTGSKNWIEYEGTGVCRPILNGAAQIDEFDATGPTGRIQGLTLRLY